jgi:hypothetical protein
MSFSCWSVKHAQGASSGNRSLKTSRKFRFDEEHNIYICPAGKVLATTGHIGPDHAGYAADPFEMSTEKPLGGKELLRPVNRMLEG